jgi:hypothetical protein
MHSTFSKIFKLYFKEASYLSKALMIKFAKQFSVEIAVCIH